MSTSPAHIHFALPPYDAHASRRELGAWGEEVAAAFLEARGYEILERNWRCRAGELDIVARSRERNALVAIEVKTRRAGGHVSSREAVGQEKYARLRRLFGLWLDERDARAPHLAIDLVGVTVQADRSIAIEHIEDLS